MKFLINALLLAACVVSGERRLGECRSNRCTPSTKVIDTFGRVAGYTEAYDDARGKVDVFLGIPYGKVNQRFADAVEPDPVHKVFQATEWGAGCPQICNAPTGYVCPVEQDEQCLSLNVFAPAGSSDRPVLFFVHGGSLEFGYSGGDVFYGDALAGRRNVVVVTANYRLGALGFLRHSENDGSSAHGSMGLRDQQRALKWVQRNIRSFGGDPSRVFLFGESAGGAAVSYHLSSPASASLFHSAAIMSGPVGIAPLTAREAEDVGHKFLKYLKCANIDCARSAKIADILRAQTAVKGYLTRKGKQFNAAMPWLPPTRTETLPLSPMDTLVTRQGWHPVPVLVGHLKDDSAGVLLWMDTLSPALYRTAVTVVFGVRRGTKILRQYPVEGSDAKPALEALLNDLVFYCSNRALGKLHTRHGNDVWMYEFAHGLFFDAESSDPNDSIPCLGRACHGFELPFVFDRRDAEAHLGKHFEERDRVVAEESSAIFAAFASRNYLHWPRFEGVEDELGERDAAWLFNSRVREVDTAHHREECHFWDKMGAFPFSGLKTPATDVQAKVQELLAVLHTHQA
ncbi:MAG: hypothetical protein MHM6MM_000843 [Cercozoa sp. M6MM]